MFDLLNNLNAYAEMLVQKHKVPAVSIAVMVEDRIYKAASGILNIDTGVEATQDSLFQIGSITKVFTACLVMRLVDAGHLELDAPVKHYLKDFELADKRARSDIRLRQLLSHTSGIDGDYYPNDYSHSGDLIARYVDRCSLLPQVQSVGNGFSYANAGYAIAGRIVEVILGIPFADAMEELVFKPLGMKQSVAKPREVLRYRAAMGHFKNAKDGRRWQTAKVCYGCMGLAPAGRLTMSASDLIVFAKAHLDRGKANNEKRWLSEESVAAMQNKEVTLPKPLSSAVTHWGLGWSLLNHPNQVAIIGHSGQTFGQSSLLKLLPKENIAFAIQTNVSSSEILHQVQEDILLELANIKPNTPKPVIKISNMQVFSGAYESLGFSYHIKYINSGLFAVVKDKVLPVPDLKLNLRPFCENAFYGYSECGALHETVIFLNKKNNVPQSLFANGRLINRVLSE